MSEEQRSTRERSLLRIGAVCAIVGAVVSVAAGANFGNLTNAVGAEAVLRALAARPSWYWPAVHLGFIVGALLWVGAFVALARSFTQGAAWVLGRLGVASIVVGTAVHVVDSSISGVGLAALADVWTTAAGAEQAALLRTGELLLWILSGTWASVVSFFHGLPFLLVGLAMMRSQHYPAWLGAVGVVGGLGSLVVGILMFLGAGFIPGGLYVVFAVIVSLWMIATGVLMWRLPDAM